MMLTAFLRFWRGGQPAAWLLSGLCLMLVSALLAGVILEGITVYSRQALLVPLLIGLASALAFAAAARRGGLWMGACVGAILMALFGPGPVAGLILTLAATLSLGLLLFPPPAAPAPLSLLLRLVAGLAGLVGLLQFAVHLRLNWAPVYIVGAIAFILLARHRLRSVLAEWVMPPRAARPFTGGDGWLAALLVGALCAASAHGANLESGYDALSMHLVVARWVQWHGFWHFDPALFDRALMPRGAGWLFTWAQLLGGEMATRLFNAACLWLTAALVLGFAANQPGDGPSRLAPVLLALIALATTPLSVWVVSQLFEETVTALFVTASLISLVLAWRDPGDRAQGMMTFLLLGAACASKTQALFFGGIGVFAVISLFRAGRWQDAMRWAIAGSVIFGVIGLKPYLQAFLVTGNPFFPFSLGVPPDTRWIGLWSWDFLYRMAFDTARYMETRDGAFGFQHILLFPLLLLAGVLSRGGQNRIVSLALLLFCAGMLSQSQYARYLFYVMPGLLLLLPSAMAQLGPIGRWALLAGLVGAVALNLLSYRALYSPRLTPSVFLQGERFSIDVPQERRVVAAINATHGAAAVVYFAGPPLNAGLIGRAHTVYSTLRHRIEAAGSADQVEAVLRDAQLTHIVIAVPGGSNAPPVALSDDLRRVLAERMMEVPLGLSEVRLFAVPR